MKNATVNISNYADQIDALKKKIAECEQKIDTKNREIQRLKGDLANKKLELQRQAKSAKTLELQGHSESPFIKQGKFPQREEDQGHYQGQIQGYATGQPQSYAIGQGQGYPTGQPYLPSQFGQQRNLQGQGYKPVQVQGQTPRAKDVLRAQSNDLKKSDDSIGGESTDE